jgi:hypothetical protein
MNSFQSFMEYVMNAMRKLARMIGNADPQEQTTDSSRNGQTATT